MIVFFFFSPLPGLILVQQPEVVGAILEAIENISSQAKRSLADSSEFGRENLLRDLSVSQPYSLALSLLEIADLVYLDARYSNSHSSNYPLA